MDYGIAQDTNSGLREKYLNKNLGTQEWLSQCDLERMLELMEMENIIHTSCFTIQDVGTVLHLAREKNKATREPYSVPLLLRIETSANEAHIHWFAAVINIDPTTNLIHYRIKDSAGLSDKDKIEIRKIIEQAIHYKKHPIQAFPNGIIDAGQCLIISEVEQLPPYSCAYHALHSLLNDSSLASVVNTNIEATAYANCSKGSSALTQYIYKKQLEGLIVSKDVLKSLNRLDDFISVIGDKSLGQLKPSKVREYLSSME